MFLISERTKKTKDIDTINVVNLSISIDYIRDWIKINVLVRLNKKAIPIGIGTALNVFTTVKPYCE